MSSNIKSLLLCSITVVASIFTNAQTLKKIILDENDIHSGHYIVVEPENKDSISGVLILLAGFGQVPENTPPETKLHNVAYSNNILTVFTLLEISYMLIR